MLKFNLSTKEIYMIIRAGVELGMKMFHVKH